MKQKQKHEEGLDKDGGEAHDRLDDDSCSKFQYHSLTHKIYEITQFKIPSGTCDPL